MDRPGVRQVPEGSGEQGKMEKTGCKIICGAPMTLVVKGLMMIDDDDERNMGVGTPTRNGEGCLQYKKHKWLDTICMSFKMAFGEG